MTIGPAPMIRIEEMSVRLGIAVRDVGHKKRRRQCRPWEFTGGTGSLGIRRGAGCLAQNRRGGKGDGDADRRAMVGQPSRIRAGSPTGATLAAKVGGPA